MRALPRNRLLALSLGAWAGVGFLISAREPEPPQLARVTVRAGRAGCQVDLDDRTVGKTGPDGVLAVKDAEPGDHYLHIHCPDQAEQGYFLSLRAGGAQEVQPAKDSPAPAAGRGASLGVQDTKVQLRRLIQEAVQLRARGRLDEAAEKIRSAMKLDPENSDLHREMGITFLLGRDWKRARVEMLEAIRHDPTDADAYNGLGYALEKLGNLEAALKEYRTATHLDPGDPTYRTHYFDMLSKLTQQKGKKK